MPIQPTGYKACHTSRTTLAKLQVPCFASWESASFQYLYIRYTCLENLQNLYRHVLIFLGVDLYKDGCLASHGDGQTTTPVSGDDQFFVMGTSSGTPGEAGAGMDWDLDEVEFWFNVDATPAAVWSLYTRTKAGL